MVEKETLVFTGAAWKDTEDDQVMIVATAQLEAPAGNSAGGRRDLTPAEVKKISAVLRLKLVPEDRRMLKTGTSGRIVRTSAGAVWVSDSGKVIDGFPAIGSVVESNPKTIIMVIVGEDARGRRVSELLDAAVPRNLVAACSVEVVDVRAGGHPPAEIGSFMDAIDGAVQWPPPNSAVIMDLNFLIGLKRCILDDSIDASLPYYRDIMGWLGCCEEIPGFAVFESHTRAPNGETTKTRAALEAFRALRFQPATMEDLRSEFARQLDTIQQLGDSVPQENPMIEPTYFGILKAVSLWRQMNADSLNANRRFDGERRFRAWDAWLETMNTNGVDVGAYCLAAVHNLFLAEGPPYQKAKGLLKVSSNPVRERLLGAAWDLFYITAVDQFATDYAGKKAVLFLSADQRLNHVNGSGRIRSVIRAGSYPGPRIMGFDLDTSPQFTPEQVACIDESHRRLHAESVRRIAKNVRIDLEFVRSLVSQVEDELFCGR